MTVFAKATGRVVALVVLLVVSAIGLRGYLPGGQPAPREQPTSSPVSVIAVVALLGLSMVIIAISLIARLRDRRVRPAPGGLSESFGGGLGRPTRRFWLLVLGAVIAWLLILLLLARLGAPQGVDQPAPDPGSSTTPRGAPARSPPAASLQDEDADVFKYLAATTVVLVVMIAAASAVASRRQRRIATSYPAPGPSEAANPASGPESLARAAELGLAEIGDLSREPRAAIIACYAAMERGLANAPGAVPQDSDTPSEVLARAVEHHALRADNASQLVELFTEARFSPHVMTERHRATAVRVLRLVLEEMRSVA